MENAFSIGEISIVGNRLILGYARAQFSADSIEIKAKGSVVKPAIPWIHPQAGSDVTLARTSKVTFVLANRQPLVVNLPDQLELDVDAKGQLELTEPEVLVQHIENELDRLLSPSQFRQYFRYWFIGLGLISNSIVESLVAKFRNCMLAKLREAVRIKLRQPRLIEEFVRQLGSQLPFAPTDDFTGLRLRFEIWPMPGSASRERYGWRILPVDPSVGFTQPTFAEYWNHLSSVPDNTVSLFLHHETVDFFVSNYLRRLYRGDSSLAMLPVNIARHPQFPWLRFPMPESEMRGVLLYFMDYVNGIQLLKPYELSLVAEGSNAPRIVFWKEVSRDGEESDFVDLQTSFVLSTGAQNHVSPVRVRLAADGLGYSRVASLEPVAEEKISVLSPTIFRVGAAVKGTFMRTLLTARLNEGIRQIRTATNTLFQFDRIRQFGTTDLPQFPVSGSAAEAVGINFCFHGALSF